MFHAKHIETFPNIQFNSANIMMHEFVIRVSGFVSLGNNRSRLVLEDGEFTKRKNSDGMDILISG